MPDRNATAPGCPDRQAHRSQAPVRRAIGGPFGLILWSGTGALAGGAIGAGKESAFLPMVDGLKARLAPGASMLILVGETPALDGLVSAVGADDSSVLRQSLTSEQANELTNAES